MSNGKTHGKSPYSIVFGCFWYVSQQVFPCISSICLTPSLDRFHRRGRGRGLLKLAKLPPVASGYKGKSRWERRRGNPWVIELNGSFGFIRIHLYSDLIMHFSSRLSIHLSIHWYSFVIAILSGWSKAWRSGLCRKIYGC